MTDQPARRTYKFAFVMITSLFFMWGFVHNLDPILIPHLRRSFSLTVLQSALVDSAVFIAYFVMALPSGLLIRKAGYKNAMLCGLALFAIGALLFIPAADTRRYVFFLGALFVIACGLTVLETAANPYVTLLGDPQRATQRLNLAQSFNGLAAMLAPIAGARVILVDGASDAQLAAMSDGARQAALAAEAASVKGPYLAIALVIVAIAVVFFFLKVPAVGAASSSAHAAPAKGAVMRALRRAPIRRAVVAQFFYVGAQVCVFSFFILYAAKAAGVSQIAAADYLGWGCGTAFVVGRFAGTCLMKYIAPARLLLGYAAACVALCAVAMFASGVASLAAVIGIAFFMSIMFPTIFSLGIEGAGADTEMGSSLIIMSIVGGAVLPLLFGAISDATHNLQYGYAAPLLCFLVIGWFARAVAREARPAVAATSTGALTHV
ncbi:FHS family L-fucose permease-like MFS transporter [Duganella sp. 1411]|uniref:L-fucose:H+ symporter permease n=1 Tax=Duganella sp. 1411 TaxID=2806572 RepID=UPI001B685890|nr:L-fucose:H+ symporter permease [Duganella sp. 1411]MBP1208002.1 FHS family L-fucose permease-like MFS transporter [Duganella sp. 1411]